MAFELQYLSRNEQTQQYDKTYNSATGNVQGPIPAIWCYNASASGSNDDATAVEAANYFNGAVGYLVVGDLIYAFTNDPGYHLLAVATNNGTNVTVATLL
jgi:hypothetical protein